MLLLFDTPHLHFNQVIITFPPLSPLKANSQVHYHRLKCMQISTPDTHLLCAIKRAARCGAAMASNPLKMSLIFSEVGSSYDFGCIFLNLWIFLALI